MQFQILLANFLKINIVKAIVVATRTEITQYHQILTPRTLLMVLQHKSLILFNYVYK